MVENEEKVIPRLGDNIPEDWIRKAESEIKTGYRSITFPEFRGEKNVEIHIYHPTSRIDSLASDIYTKTFNRLIRDEDLLTKKQLLDNLNKRSIWTEEDDKDIQNKKEKMREIEWQVAKMRQKGGYNKATMSRLRITWEKYRDELTEKISGKNELLSNSIEGRAEEEELKIKLSYCVKYQDGSLVWPTPKHFDDEINKIFIVTILNEALMFWAGLTQEIISELPTKLIFGGEEPSEVLPEK